MGALKNPRHEAYAMARFNGMGIHEAYQAAGYKPDRGNASRFTANDSIRARIKELQEAKITKTIHYATVDVLEQLHTLIDLVKEAAAAGDYTNAIKGQSYVLRIFGFEDSPTLAHEMLGSRKMKHHNTEPTETPAHNHAQPNANGVGRFAHVLAHLEKATKQ